MKRKALKTMHKKKYKMNNLIISIRKNVRQMNNLVKIKSNIKGKADRGFDSQLPG